MPRHPEHLGVGGSAPLALRYTYPLILQPKVRPFFRPALKFVFSL